MPLNYLSIGPQIKEYCAQAVSASVDREKKVDLALGLLERCAQAQLGANLPDPPDLSSHHPKNRCARLRAEIVNQSHQPSKRGDYVLLASDGSQITSSHHDALPISLINTSIITFYPGSGCAPKAETHSEFVKGENGDILLEFIPEDKVNLLRDVAELKILADHTDGNNFPVIAISDGPIELFHEPRSGSSNQKFFDTYLKTLSHLAENGKIIGGYIDKPRANLVVRLLEILFCSGAETDLSGVTDSDLFGPVLEPGCRSSIFKLNSPSSIYYTGPSALNFFYLNVGFERKPWIVRVEISESTAGNPDNVRLLHHALLDQCRLMGRRPYPYILHRAHEEAVVHLGEKSNISAMIAQYLFESGIPLGEKSYKLSAKELQKRTGMD